MKSGLALLAVHLWEAERSHPRLFFEHLAGQVGSAGHTTLDGHSSDLDSFESVLADVSHLGCADDWAGYGVDGMHLLAVARVVASEHCRLG